MSRKKRQRHISKMIFRIKSENEIEQLLIDSEFEKEAFEGFESMPNAVQLLDKLPKEFNPKSKEKKDTIVWLIPAMAASVIALMGIFWFISEPTNLDNKVADNITPKENINEQNDAILTSEKEEIKNSNNDISSSKENEPKDKKSEETFNIEESTPVVSEPLADAKPMKDSDDEIELSIQPTHVERKSIAAPVEAVIEEAEYAEEDVEIVEFADAEIELEEIESIPQTSFKKINTENNLTSNSTARERVLNSDTKSNGFVVNDKTNEIQVTSAPANVNQLSTLNSMADRGTFDYYAPQNVLGYKVVNNDYRILAKNDTKKKRSKLYQGSKVKSTSPQYESKYESDSVKDISAKEKTIQKSYDDVLHSALTQLKQKEYKLALTYFDDILNNYPNDLNALYYGAEAHKNLSNDSIAIQWLSKVIQQKNPIFMGDAQWQKAQLLEKNNDKTEALKVYQSIADSVYHPYAEQAQMKIIALEKE